MFFAALTFIAAFSIEAIGTVVSVIGLSTLFGANPIIMTMAVALDVGKLVVVALLYKYWGELNKLMRAYGLIAACITMIITSAGAAGYLAGEFQKAIVGTQEGALKVQVLKEEQLKLEARKKQIDDQIANLPSNFSRSRVTLMKQFEEEQKQVTARLAKINEELPQVKIAQISTEAKAGPILYIAKAFGITVEEAVKWVILMIIFVFDPLAVFLIVAGNFLLDRHRRSALAGLDVVAVAGPPSIIGVAQPSADAVTKRQIDDEYLNQVDDRHTLHDDGPVARTYQEVAPEFKPPIEEDEPVIAQVQGPTNYTPPPEALQQPPHPTFNDPAPAPVKSVMDDKLQHEIEQASRAGMSLEAWRETQLAKLDRIQGEVDAINALVQPREQITKSTLGLVEPDPTVRGLDQMEIGYKTGAYRSGTQSK